MRRPEYERMTPLHSLTSLGETHDPWILAQGPQGFAKTHWDFVEIELSLAAGGGRPFEDWADRR